MAPKIPPSEIRKASRKLLADFFSLATPARTKELRDILQNIAKVADSFYKKTARSKTVPRPPEAWLIALESFLAGYVQSDVEKWAKTKQLMEVIGLQIRHWPIVDDSPIMKTKAEFEKLLRVLLRDSPGRKANLTLQETYREAARLHTEERWSFRRIARKLFAEEFKKSPENAIAKTRRGVKRLKK